MIGIMFMALMVGLLAYDVVTHVRSAPDDPIMLWVDKDETAPEGWTWTTSVELAIAIINSTNVHTISMADDFAPGDGSAYEIAIHLEQRAVLGYPLPEVYLHSAPGRGQKLTRDVILGAQRMLAQRNQSASSDIFA